ncbi:hypothetical protein [Streptomyces sp. NBC_01304]|uniref:EF-Tu C-terminal domain-related protein n=1 Tax=Streptomyces sp. NBC_01304 TaxID=2903818 RepID=UPI002E119796|nr:hypothetical protein OG430_02200 [Streptomyces sp. NBC_01304]
MAHASEKPFLMPVSDVFRPQQGRVVMAVGLIERGRVRQGDVVEIVGPDGGATAVVADIEQSRTRIGEASAEMNVGLFLQDVAADAVGRGQVLAMPGSIGAQVAFSADITLLSEEQGSGDVGSGDRLLFYPRTAAVWGTVTLPEGADVVRPLHGGEVTVVLDEAVALEEGQTFAFRRKGRAAGSGTVTQLLR